MVIICNGYTVEDPIHGGLDKIGAGSSHILASSSKAPTQLPAAIYLSQRASQRASVIAIPTDHVKGYAGLLPGAALRISWFLVPSSWFPARVSVGVAILGLPKYGICSRETLLSDLLFFFVVVNLLIVFGLSAGLHR